jgi:hypothetical protein
MEPLEVNLDYTRTELDENELSVNGEFALPFYWLGYEWMADFKEDVTFSSEQPTAVTSKAELAVDIPTDFHTWQASVEQAYYLNRDGEEDLDQWYLISSGRFGSSIPLGFELPGFSEVNYNPAVITSVAYKPGYSLSEDRRGFALGAEHGVTTGRIDWKGNFRDGAELAFTQDARWNFARERWLSALEAEMQVHKSFGFMGFSSRIEGFYSYGGLEEDAGGPIRGILDKRLEGDAGVFANFDFPFEMWIWFLDRWFDGHLGPFFDYALVSPVGQDGFDLSDSWYGVGLEAFAYPKAARSIYLRMSLGLDLEAMLEGASLGDEAPRDGEPIYELYIGLGHHY